MEEEAGLHPERTYYYKTVDVDLLIEHCSRRLAEQLTWRINGGTDGDAATPLGGPS